jgi:diguanylate cyclase (GGDEF)-like protein
MTSERPAGLPLIDAMLDAVWLVDSRDLCIVAANPAAGVLMGAPAAELIGRDMLELAATPEDLCFWSEVAAGLAEAIESETWVRRLDGTAAPVTRRVSCLAAQAGAAEARALYVVALHDRSAERRAERERDALAADLQATLESTADGVLVTDLAGHIRNFNQRFAQLWAVPPDLLLRRDDDAVLGCMQRSLADPAAYMRRLAALDEPDALPATDVLTLACGTVLERVMQPQRSRGEVIGRVASFRDITERVQARERIDLLSHTDALTGLPNRRRLADRIELALAAGRREGTPFALLHIDLDRFKPINDTLGQALGDRVLVDVAERLKGCLREIDIVARLGSDEFVVLAQRSDAAGAEATARRLLEALQASFVQGGMSFTVTASIGIALYPEHGSGQDELLSGADTAMHEAKAAGRGAYRLHQPRNTPGDSDLRARMLLDHSMRQALVQQRFRLNYQPQVDMHTGQVLGAEALIRWRDPERGEVPPAQFIPVAEESGFIIAIGHWVLRQAVSQAAAWRQQGLQLVMSVNVSALQFQQPGFVEGVAAVLREAALPPKLLELELTESILVQDAHGALLRLQALAALGVKLAIDDFGTGYSSLSYLKRFPIGRLKIDRSFVAGLPTDQSDAGLVNAIIQMGRALHLETVAEGVETEAQRQFLRQAGCEQFQGFLFAPALAVPDFEALLARPAAGQRVVRLHAR